MLADLTCVSSTGTQNETWVTFRVLSSSVYTRWAFKGMTISQINSAHRPPSSFWTMTKRMPISVSSYRSSSGSEVNTWVGNWEPL